MVDAKFSKMNSSVTLKFIIDSSHVSQKSKVYMSYTSTRHNIHAKLHCYNCENDLKDIDATYLKNIGKAMAATPCSKVDILMGY